jgi:hypothetical protein
MRCRQGCFAPSVGGRDETVPAAEHSQQQCKANPIFYSMLRVTLKPITSERFWPLLEELLHSSHAHASMQGCVSERLALKFTNVCKRSLMTLLEPCASMSMNSWESKIRLGLQPAVPLTANQVPSQKQDMPERTSCYVNTVQTGHNVKLSWMNEHIRGRINKTHACPSIQPTCT